jgi:hypothetical protein
VVLKLASWEHDQKNVTPAFDRSIGGGCSFGDLAILVAFWFGKGTILDLHG